MHTPTEQKNLTKRSLCALPDEVKNEARYSGSKTRNDWIKACLDRVEQQQKALGESKKVPLLSTYYVSDMLSTFCRIQCGRNNDSSHFIGGKADVARSFRDPPPRANQLMSGALDTDIFVLKTQFMAVKYM